MTTGSPVVDHLLIGGGVAAASCAERLRAEGAPGRIVIVGREPDPPYRRPPLSKGYLRGTEGRADALLHPAGWWADNDIELLTRTSVMKIDPGERVVRLSSREEVRFDTALIATGANVRRLRAPGAELDGIHYLRAFGNADAIRAEADSGERIVVIGGSFLGTELAASLTALGMRCTVVMQESLVLDRHFGAAVAGFLQHVLEEHGIDVRGADELERFEGAHGRVEAVVTAAGHRLPCDCAVVAAGVVPDVMLARSAGLELGPTGGVACSPRLETSLPGVYAAGDVAQWESALHGRPARVEHWEVAADQGRTAALNMLGRRVDHQAVPYFWCDLADWTTIEYVGVGSGHGEPAVRGSFDDGRFTAFYSDSGGRLTGALTVGRADDLEHARRLIARRATPDPRLLADPDSELALL